MGRRWYGSVPQILVGKLCLTQVSCSTGMTRGWLHVQGFPELSSRLLSFRWNKNWDTVLPWSYTIKKWTLWLFLFCISPPKNTIREKKAREKACLFFLHLAVNLVSDKLYTRSWKYPMDKTHCNLLQALHGKFGDIISELNGWCKKKIQSASREGCKN